MTELTQADIDKAVKDAISQIQFDWAADVEGLKKKNNELVVELRQHKQIDPADVAKLEEENDRLKADLTKATKEAKDAAKLAETATKQLESESGFTSKLLTENALNASLAEAGVTNPAMLKAVKAMMAGTAQVVADGTDRVVKIGDKALADHIKEWAGTDEAKHFISAGNNSGGGAPGGKGGGGGKTMSNTDFNAMQPKARAAFMAEGGKVVDQAA